MIDIIIVWWQSHKYKWHKLASIQPSAPFSSLNLRKMFDCSQGGLGPGRESQVWGVLQWWRRERPWVVRTVCERTGECKVGKKDQQPGQHHHGKESGGQNLVEWGQRQLGQHIKAYPWLEARVRTMASLKFLFQRQACGLCPCIFFIK